MYDRPDSSAVLFSFLSKPRSSRVHSSRPRHPARQAQAEKRLECKIRSPCIMVHGQAMSRTYQKGRDMNAPTPAPHATHALCSSSSVVLGRVDGLHLSPDARAAPPGAMGPPELLLRSPRCFSYVPKTGCRCDRQRLRPGNATSAVSARCSCTWRLGEGCRGKGQELGFRAWGVWQLSRDNFLRAQVRDPRGLRSMEVLKNINLQSSFCPSKLQRGSGHVRLYELQPCLWQNNCCSSPYRTLVAE